jgi:hypothetical protein
MPISITGAARAFSLEGGVQPKNLLTNLRLWRLTIILLTALEQWGRNNMFLDIILIFVLIFGTLLSCFQLCGADIWVPWPRRRPRAFSQHISTPDSQHMRCSKLKIHTRIGFKAVTVCNIVELWKTVLFLHL